MSSKSYDWRLDIPAHAYLNHQVLRMAEQRNDIQRAKEEVFSSPPYVNQGLDPKRFSILDNPAHTVSLLYCLVVVPKEILDLPEDHLLFKQLDQLDFKKAFQISVFPPKFDQSPSYWLLRSLRNSIAHVLYKIDESSGMHFWTEKEPRWDAYASLEGLSFFLSTFGAALANILLFLRRQQSS